MRDKTEQVLLLLLRASHSLHAAADSIDGSLFYIDKTAAIGALDEVKDGLKCFEAVMSRKGLEK